MPPSYPPSESLSKYTERSQERGCIVRFGLFHTVQGRPERDVVASFHEAVDEAVRAAEQLGFLQSGHGTPLEFVMGSFPIA